MATANNAARLSMKLRIDTGAQRVLFAEASKDVVDFLFSLLALPVGTAVSLLGEDAMVGCVANLYGSVEKLDGTYLLPGVDKDALLRPVMLSTAASSTNSSLLRLPPPPSKGGFFKCTYCGGYVTDTSGTACPCRYGTMTTSIQFVAGGKAAAGGGGAAKGFVQGIVTYTVMDDLTVTPMSSISSITLLNTFGVRNLAALQEKTVQIDYDQGLKILKASLESKTVLTDVFLGKKIDTARPRSKVGGKNPYTTGSPGATGVGPRPALRPAQRPAPRPRIS